MLHVEGMPNGSKVDAVGVDTKFADRPIIEIGPDQTRELRVLVTSPAGVKMPESTPIVFRLTESVMGEVVTANDFFKAP